MKYVRITSPLNPLAREAIKIKEKRRKHKHEAFLIEGPHLIEMALTPSDAEIKRVFFTEDFGARKEGQRLLRQIGSRVRGLPLQALSRGQGSGGVFFEVSEQIFRRLADTETPQGIVALVSYRPVELKDISFKGIPLLVICDGIQDPGNLGTIIRVSDAAGADSVIILPGTCDAFMSKTIRATAGSLFNIPIVYSDIENLLQYINSKNIALYAADVHAAMSIYEADLNKPMAIAFGNETHGASEALLRKAKGLLKIPIIGRAESLNVAMAASVFIYEAVRQRMYLG